MQTEIVISGFGGQGALFAGQLLAYAAMDAGLQVTWIPSYGPEMRGGTAHCTVIISKDEIGSPLVRNPSAVIAMNRPSLEKYEPLVKPGGVLIVNSSLCPQRPTRTDIQVVEIPANAVAEEIGPGARSVANLVLTGALLAVTQVLPVDVVETALINHLPQRHRELLDLNRHALRQGAALALASPA
jgi:2-oxoglutarate ferredoxin oxidoreductase subunit gamma